jgi:hypothetical protein
MRRDTAPLHDFVASAVLYSIGIVMYLYSIVRFIVRGCVRCTVWGACRITALLSRCNLLLGTIVIYYGWIRELRDVYPAFNMLLLLLLLLLYYYYYFVIIIIININYYYY